ncbi:MAG: cyclic-di-AMP receptor [Oscillospiraceae bacterium]|nr:cyclic-di-AMP receptor [Oscillospiraceae bacterium]
MDSNEKNKLILAILSKEDYDTVIVELNEHGIFATKLSTSGGFLKKENVTVMIGVPESKLAETLDLLRKNAGRRKESGYAVPPTSAPIPGIPFMQTGAFVPVTREVGGVTIFVLDMGQMEKW